MQILGLLGMYFDAAVVFVTNSSLVCDYRLTYVASQSCALPKNVQIHRLDTYISYIPRVSISV